jgi:hypothetical protein
MPLERPSPSSDDHPQPLRRASTLRNITSSVTDTTYKAAANITKATRDAINADVPLGAWAAAAEASSKAPTLGEIRKGSFVETGWTERAHWQDANGTGQRLAKIRDFNIENEPAIDDDPMERTIGRQRQSTGFATYGLPLESDEDAKDNPGAAPAEVLEFPPIKELYSNENDDNTPKLVASFDGMLDPSEDDSRPKVTWTRSTIIGLRAFWKWFLTPFGFLVTIYALNVVAWGGMLFLLLLNAAPAMCWALDEQKGWIRDCDNLQSSRRI